MTLLALLEWKNLLTFYKADPYRFAILNYLILNFKVLITIDRKSVNKFWYQIKKDHIKLDNVLDAHLAC